MADEENADAGEVEELPAEENEKDKGSSGGNPLIPVLAVCILIPAISFGMFQFMFLPMMKEQIVKVADALKEEIVVDEHAANADDVAEGDHHGAGGGVKSTYLVGDLVANLAGTRQSRYLKLNLTLEGTDGKTADGKPLVFTDFMTANSAKVSDVIGGVVNAIELSDLEQPGIRNLIRKDLVNALNSNFRGPRVTDVFFSEWVVQ